MKILFLLLIFVVAAYGQEIPGLERTGSVPPCQSDSNAAKLGDILPDCDEFGFHAPKQCNAEHTLCWCVTRCGEPLMETKGGPDIVCEQDDPPCTKEVASLSGVRERFGKYKPRCHDNGFYHHRQCLGSVCWCTDRCGNQIASSKHPIWTRGACDCADEDYAWKCTTNPCDLEMTTCPAHPDAICTPSGCGSCAAKFYVKGKEVECALPEPEIIDETEICTEGERWKVDKCIECMCMSGEAACMSPQCAGPPFGWDNCAVKAGMEDVCCPEYDCKGCMDTLRQTHYDVGESWDQEGDPCHRCTCNGDDDVSCVREICPGVNRYIPPLCRWVIRTGECCPRDHSQNGIVCDESISACGPGFTVIQDCPSDLCLTATCDGHPDAQCKISHCGPCHTVFYNSDGVKVECLNEAVVSEPMCSGPTSTCIVSPCTAEPICSNYPDAVCRVDSCHPCTPVFYDDRNKLLDCGSPFDIREMCDETHAVGDRWEESCMTCECTASLTPACIPHECGEAPPLPTRCRWAKQTPDECCPSKMVCEESLYDCPFGASVASSCPDDLCDTTCEGHPDATCLISRCGGCSAKFFDQNNQTVQCHGGTLRVEPECPSDVPQMTCIVSPCDVTTCDHPRFPDAVCHVDYCQPCTAVFHCPCNELLDCDEKKDTIECTDSSNEKHDVGETWIEGCNECTCEETGILACRAKTCDTATCERGHRVGERWEESCMTCECTTSLMPACIPHECGRAPPLPDLCYLAKQTPDECCPSKIVCEEAISLCPEGAAVAETCPDDLCDTTCEGHPNATCLISRCGGCEAKFFDQNGQRVRCAGGLVVSRPICPENLPPASPLCMIVICQLTPCQNRPDAVCHIDACQPCDIVYYDEFNQKINCLAETKVDEIECKDSSNQKHDVGETWIEGCNECTCEGTGIPACRAKTCDTGPLPPCSDGYQTTPQGTQTLPRCLKNGDYSAKQCDTTGDCWCVNPDGSVVTEQHDVPPGKELVCVSEPPCHREILDNKQKTERGEVVTSDPVCSSTGWYEPTQCSPTTGECWCTERDGTVVIGSVRPQDFQLDCNAQCMGDAFGIVPTLVCSKEQNGCTSISFCHIPPNHTKGKCCYLPYVSARFQP